MSRTVHALLLAAMVALMVTSTQAFKLEYDDAAVDEETIRGMKIKELREFIKARGVTCSGCSSKEEFLETALKNKDKAVSGRSRPKMPKQAFWEVWSEIAFDICTAKNLPEGQCKILRSVVESSAMQHGKRTAKGLKKDPKDILRTSINEPYYEAGRSILDKTVAAIKQNGANLSAEKIQKILESDVQPMAFKQYVTECGVENTNPMYETLKPKKKGKGKEDL